MAKTNKKRKGLSDVVTTKKSTATKLNPFDVRTVRPKQSVLGRKMKNDVGKPGVARAKAIQKRKETLLQEYKIRNKSNMFLDKRIGEKDTNLSAEDKMIARFTAERLKNAGKGQSIFNLGDDTFELTHGGTSLRDIDKFENPGSDDDDIDEEKKLSAQFVDEAHFGGFMTRADDEFKSGKANSRKEWIENLIRESKKRKAEKRKLEEETEEKTQELDDNWKIIMQNLGNSGLTKRKGRDDDEKEAKQEYDPYDMLVRQMTFERKEARGSERMKTEDEKIKEDAEKLKKLEEDRLRRMRGEDEAANEDERRKKSGQLSVEDMNDPEVKKKNKLSKKEKRELIKQLLQQSEDNEDEEEGDEEEDGDDGEEEEGDDDEDDEEDGESEEEDKYSDLEESDEEEEEGDKADKAKGQPIKENENEKDRYDAARAEMMAAAAREIPYSFCTPDTYEELAGHLQGRSLEDRTTIMERIIKCNHISLGEENKEKLHQFFALLLQYVQECADSYDPDCDAGKKGLNSLEELGLAAIQATIPFLIQLTSMFQQLAAKTVQEVIKEKFEEFEASPKKRLPGLDTLIFMKIVFLIFPTSDYRHPVVTPCYTLITSILAKARPVDRNSLVSGLVMASLLTESILLSGRFVPELVNFLLGMVQLAGSKGEATRPIPPFRGGDLLVLKSDLSDQKCPPKVRLSDLSSVREITDQFRASCLHGVIQLINRIADLYRELPAASEVLHPLKAAIGRVESARLPTDVSSLFSEVMGKLDNLPKKSGALVKPQKQVAMLHMLEPKIDEDFRPFEKKREGNRDLLEQQKMRHKLKQERKGARKEIRKDVAFLADQRARELRAKDDERRARTRTLMAGLANQEGEYNAMQRKNKKKKF